VCATIGMIARRRLCPIRSLRYVPRGVQLRRDPAVNQYARAGSSRWGIEPVFATPERIPRAARGLALMTPFAHCRANRLTNAFSKKIENHTASVALHFMHYNFCRLHQTLRVTPAMEAGISSHVWSIAKIVGLLDATDEKAA
jgi:hypothetical protein